MRKRKNMKFFKINNRRSMMNRSEFVDNKDLPKEISIGDTGENVYKIQNMLTRILDIHRNLPVIIVDGNFGQETKRAIMKFQEMMGINVTGSVDSTTLRELEKEYNLAIKENREDTYTKNMNTKQGFLNEKYDSKIVGIGSSGPNVIELQTHLNEISDIYDYIPKLTVDGQFGPKTEEAVKIFQGLFNLPTDGIVGKYTWTAIFDVRDGKITPNIEDEEN